MLDKYCRNSKVTILTDPIRMTSNMIEGYFMFPYLYAIGITATAVGKAQSVGAVLGVFCSLIAASIIGKLGRKLSTTIFWDIAYIIGPVFLLLAQRWQGAVVVNFILIIGISRIGSTAYSLLKQEDEKEENRSFIYTFSVTISMMAGCFLPIFGFFLVKMTIVQLMPIVLVVGVIVESVITYVRFKLFQEPEAGKKQKLKSDGISIFEVFNKNIKNAASLLKNKKYRLILLIYGFVTVTSAFSMFFPAFFMGKNIITQAEYAYIGFGYSAFAIIANFIILPNMKKRKVKDSSIYIYSSLFCSLIFISFIFLKEGMFIPIFIIYGLYGATFLFSFSLAGVFPVSFSDDKDRADLYGTCNFVTEIIMIFLPMILGKLIDTNLNFACLFCALIWLICFLFGIGFKRQI